MEKVRAMQNYIFNSPLELGLRLLFIFAKTSINMDLQRLVYYNYLLIHSADVLDGPLSIHPELPLRSCELMVNRTVLKKSLTLLVSKNLVDVTYSEKEGIIYSQNSNTEEFVNYFQSNYSKMLRERAQWLCDSFDKFTGGQVADLVETNLGKWGSEFTPVRDEVDDFV